MEKTDFLIKNFKIIFIFSQFSARKGNTHEICIRWKGIQLIPKVEEMAVWWFIWVGGILPVGCFSRPCSSTLTPALSQGSEDEMALNVEPAAATFPAAGGKASHELQNLTENRLAFKVSGEIARGREVLRGLYYSIFSIVISISYIFFCIILFFRSSHQTTTTTVSSPSTVLSLPRRRPSSRSSALMDPPRPTSSSSNGPRYPPRRTMPKPPSRPVPRQEKSSSPSRPNKVFYPLRQLTFLWNKFLKRFLAIFAYLLLSSFVISFYPSIS